MCIDQLLNFKNMKHNLLFLLPFLFFLASGCSEDSINGGLPNNAPEGTFTGQFTLIHVHAKTGITDTLTAALVLNIEMTTGFKITGDTSTLHAGSYGSYEVSSNGGSGQIEFLDKTYPTSGTPVKIHLDGIYDYIYDGTNLQLAAYSPLDTVEYFYKFTKTGN